MERNERDHRNRLCGSAVGRPLKSRTIDSLFAYVNSKVAVFCFSSCSPVSIFIFINKLPTPPSSPIPQPCSPLLEPWPLPPKASSCWDTQREITLYIRPWLSIRQKEKHIEVVCFVPGVYWRILLRKRRSTCSGTLEEHPKDTSLSLSLSSTA